MPQIMGEFGRIGQRRYGGIFSEEFLKELQGKHGIESYREMSENDDVCGAIIFVIEMLIRGRRARDGEQVGIRLQLFQQVGIGVYHRDVVVQIGQRLREVKSHLAVACNDYVHFFL